MASATSHSQSAVPRRAPADLRVLIVHEWLYTWAGAERCLEQLLQVVPRADVIAGTVTESIRAQQPIARRARETWLGSIPGARRHHRWFLPLQPLAFATIDTSGYDLLISISHSFAKLARTSGATRHLCYCLSPPRYLWDLRDTYARHSPAVQGLALRVAGAPLRWIDRRGALRVDRFVSISKVVADRVRGAYGRDSGIVHPPVSAKGPQVDVERQPFLLTLGRLVPYKRVDVAIRAAELLGGRLVVAGDGPDRTRLEAIAGANTQFTGAVSDAEAARLLSTCRAFVFCAEEDFGIAPLEANAHGAPVVAYGRGGSLETIVDGETGMFFHRPEPEAAAAAISACLARAWDPRVLRRNAERFSPERFRSAMTSEISAIMDNVGSPPARGLAAGRAT